MNTEYYFSYLDHFPQIPDEVLPTPQQVIDAEYWSNGEKFESMRHPGAVDHYFRKRVNPELKEWMLANLKLDSRYAAMFCIFNRLMFPHRDIRDETYNFILTTGGEVRTEWYNKQVEETVMGTWDSIRDDTSQDTFVSADQIVTLESVLIQPKRWHRLKTDIPHGTSGPHSSPRIILSVITENMVQIPKNHPLLTEAVENWFKEW